MTYNCSNNFNRHASTRICFSYKGISENVYKKMYELSFYIVYNRYVGSCRQEPTYIEF